MKKCLYLDDRKTPVKAPPGYADWMIVRSYEEFVDYIKNEKMPDYVSLSHDLHPEHDADFAKYQLQGIPAIDYAGFTERTGLDAARFLCNWVEASEILTLPRIIGVHSDNPLGAANIVSYVQGFIKHIKGDQMCYVQKPEFLIENK